MIIVKGFENIKFGKTIQPKDEDLPYLMITVLSGNNKGEREVGSLVWDETNKQWEIRSREETKEMVKQMDKSKLN